MMLAKTRTLLVLEEDSRGHVTELLAAVEAGDLENEHVAHNVALQLLNKVGGSVGRATYNELATKSMALFPSPTHR